MECAAYQVIDAVAGRRKEALLSLPESVEPSGANMDVRVGRPGWSVVCRLFACLVVLLSADRSAGSQPPLVLSDIAGAEPLFRHVSVLRDPSASLSLEEVLAQTDRFVPAADAQDLALGYTQDTVWLRLEVASHAEQPLQRLIEFEYPYLELITFHKVAHEGVARSLAGSTLSPEHRAYRHRQALFPLQLAPGEHATLYLQVRTQGSMTLNSNVWEPQAFHERDAFVSLMIAVYTGMLLAFGLYNLLLFLGTRQISFLYYSLFVMSFGTAVLTINGIGPLYLWSSMGTAGSRMLPLGFTLSTAFAMMFARSFLNTARYVPGWDVFLKVAAVVAWVASALCLVLPMQIALYQMSIIGVATTLVLFSVGVHCVVRKAPGARIFVLAWAMLLIGGTMLALRNLGLLPSNVITLYGIQFGSALEMLLLSFGLAARFNALKRQREAAQTALVRTLREQEVKLEQRVAERTQQLAEANTKLSLLATRDALTGLANRNALDEHLFAALRRTARRGDRLALIMIDLDGFKDINDTFGHEAGDGVLVAVAERMQAVARESDFLARFGGDEFVVVAEQVEGEVAATAIAERLHRAISDEPYLVDCALQLGASIGISLSDGESITASQLLRDADLAMYRRKRAGKGGVSLFALED
jgi:two-component system, sensor histidine kinase LadS